MDKTELFIWGAQQLYLENELDEALIFLRMAKKEIYKMLPKPDPKQPDPRYPAPEPYEKKFFTRKVKTRGGIVRHYFENKAHRTNVMLDVAKMRDAGQDWPEISNAVKFSTATCQRLHREYRGIDRTPSRGRSKR